jgi:hypothetical protein
MQLVARRRKPGTCIFRKVTGHVGECGCFETAELTLRTQLSAGEVALRVADRFKGRPEGVWAPKYTSNVDSALSVFPVQSAHGFSEQSDQWGCHGVE